MLLGSRVIGESITLKNVRQFYCLTPHWNDSTVDQAIGRVIRNKSHASLREDERNVKIYIHVSIFPDNPHNSVDIKKLMKCKEKERSILKVARRMVNEAVDRYCLDSDLPIDQVDTFAAAYVHHHEAGIARSVSRILLGVPDPVNVYDLSGAIGIHPTVCKEVLCRMISSNARVGSGFIRAYWDTVFIVDDPSIPYVTMPPLGRVLRSRTSELPDGRTLLQGMDTEFPNAIQAFRRMQTRDKAALLEHCVQEGVLEVLEQISTAYACIDGTVYHLLLYRDLESSYTSSNPVPKRPLGRTRAFDGVWRTVESLSDERVILDAYRGMVSSTLERADELLPVYGIISAIDGDMRLRLRNTEDHSKSSSDRRYIKRGKNIRSIRKEQLLDIVYYMSRLPKLGIGSVVLNKSVPINEIAELIDRTIVGAGLYAVL